MMRRSLGAIGISVALAAYAVLPACGIAGDFADASEGSSRHQVKSVPDARALVAASDAAFVGPKAAASLPESETSAVLHWQHALIKRCDARDALGMTRDAPRPVSSTSPGAIDLSVLRAQLHQDSNRAMPMLVTPQEHIIFGRPQAVQGTMSTVWIAGGVQVTASLADGVCTLRADDAVLYRAALATRVPVEGRIADGALSTPVLKRTYAVRQVGRRYVGVREHGLFDAVQQGMLPDAGTYQRMAERLNINAVQARTLFASGKAPSWPAALQVLHGKSVPWFSRITPDIMGTEDDVASLLGRGDVDTRVRMIMRAAAWPTGAELQNAPSTWLTLEAAVHITPTDRAALDVQLRSLHIAEPLWIDAYTGSRCLQDRAAVLLGKPEGGDAVVPAWSSIAEPCAVFDDEAHPHGYTDGVYMDLLPQVLRHTRPGPRVDWRGWDMVLLRVAADLQRNQQDIAQALDPRGQAPAIDLLSDSLSVLDRALPAYPRLHNQHAAITRMVAVQALRGVAAGPERLAAMLAALDLAFDAFPDAVPAWVMQLEQDSMPQDATFATVRRMTPAYIQTAHEAADLAARYHDRNFDEQVYRKILQTPPSVHSLQAYIDTTRRRHAQERFYP